MRLTIEPGATVLLLAAFEDAVAILAALFVVALVTLAVWPDEFSKSVHFSILPLPFVFSLV